MPAAVDTMFYVREVPWHGLGVRVENVLNAADAIKAAGLTWKVELTPSMNLFKGEAQLVPDMFNVTRMDTGKVFGTVTERYVPIQNDEAFEFADSIIGTNEAKYETAGALNDGERVFILARLPEDIKVAGEDIAPYFLLANAHNGRNALIVTETPIRVVCQNTLNAALQGAKRQVKIRHSRQYEQRLADARKVLGFTKQYYTDFLSFANDLVAKKFTRSQYETLVETLAPIPEAKDGIEAKRGKTMAIKTQERLLVCYDAEDLNNIRGTAWGAYNAIADYSDHVRTLKDMSGKDGNGISSTDKLANAERAWTRTFEGTDLKDRALELLTATA